MGTISCLWSLGWFDGFSPKHFATLSSPRTLRRRQNPRSGRTIKLDHSSSRTSVNLTCMENPNSNLPLHASSGPDPQNVTETDAETENSNQVGSSVRSRRHSHTPPPYWQHSREPSSSDELSSYRPPPIILEDHTLSRAASRAALWAKAITIDDYVIVRGSPTGIGAYVVWNCRVQTLDGGPMTIRKRYSEFDELRSRLIQAFPQSTKSSLPPLPPKSAIYKFRPKFLERRREGLAYFLNCVMLNPEYAGSTIVKDFVFPPES